MRGPPLPRIRFRDLRHTHASVLVASGEPIKVVSERLCPRAPPTGSVGANDFAQTPAGQAEPG